MLWSPLLLGVLLRNLYGHCLYFRVFSQATFSPGHKRKTRSQGRAQVPPASTRSLGHGWGRSPRRQEEDRLKKARMGGGQLRLPKGRRKEAGHPCPAVRFQDKRESWWVHPKALSSRGNCSPTPKIPLTWEPLGPSGPPPQNLQGKSPSRTTLLTFLFRCRTS